jgi:hypothetical protein
MLALTPILTPTGCYRSGFRQAKGLSAVRQFHFFFDTPGSSFSIGKPYAENESELAITTGTEDMREARVVFRDKRRTLFGVQVHTGLTAQVVVDGPDLDTALREATGLVQAQLSLAALQSDATVGQPLLLGGHETTPGAETTEFIQIERPEPELMAVGRRTRELDLARLERLSNALYGITDPELAARIGRAIRWYRKGLSEEDQFDQFTNYWLGLEALNVPLRTLLKVGPEYEKCKVCGDERLKSQGDGVRALFLEHAPRQMVDWKECRGFRVQLLHGIGSLAELDAKVPAQSNLCRVLLRIGIYLLLGYTAVEAVSEDLPVYNVHTPYTEYRGFYHISPSDLTETPWLTISTEVASIEGTDETRRAHFVSTLHKNVDVTVSIRGQLVREAGIETKVTSAGPLISDDTPVDVDNPNGDVTAQTTQALGEDRGLAQD